MTETIDAAESLDVAVTIGDRKPALYFNQVNTLTITLTNNTGTSCTLKPGAAVREDALKPDGPTSIYLWFGGALTSDEMLSLGFTLPDEWTAHVFTDDDASCVAIVPKQAVPPLLNGDAIELTLTNIFVSGAVRTPTFTVDTMNVPGLPPGTWSTSLPIQNPATGRELGFDPTAVGNGVVFVTQFNNNKISNRLAVALTNGGDAIPVQDGKSPSIGIRFVYSTGDGFTALTTPDASTAIQLKVFRLGSQGREELHPQPIDVAPSKDQPGGRMWTLNPPGSQLLDAGGSFELYFDTIVTTLEAGRTLLYLQFTGMGPDYNDHCYTVGIDKEIPDPGVVYLRCLESRVFTAGEPVLLEWQTVGVDKLTLYYVDTTVAGQRSVVLTSDAADPQLRIPLNASGANAFALPSPPLATTTVHASTDPPSSEVTPVDIPVITPPVVITSIAAAPAAANFAQGPLSVTISWQVTPKNLVTKLLLSIPGSADVEVTGSDSHTIPSCSTPGPFKLTAFGLGKDQTELSISIMNLVDYLASKQWFKMENDWLGSDGTVVNWRSHTVDTIVFGSNLYAECWVRCEVDHGDNTYDPHPLFFSWCSLEQPFSLNGQTINISTSLGTLQLVCTDKGTLQYSNPPNIPDCDPDYTVRATTTEMKPA